MDFPYLMLSIWTPGQNKLRKSKALPIDRLQSHLLLRRKNKEKSAINLSRSSGRQGDQIDYDTV
jgi:hypothetical protein